MPARTRFSTATVIDSNYLAPWLAAEGPLAYNPAQPPARDYFFQYTRILPELFNPRINLREHRYFGSPLKESAGFLFDFWAKARSNCGAALQRYFQLGVVSDDEVRTPIAAYRYVRKLYNTAGSLLIQHDRIARIRQGTLARGPAVIFAESGDGSAQIRPKPCGDKDSIEQHPDHYVLCRRV